MKKGIKADLVAPCGMNCDLCIAYQRTHDRCLGCNIGCNKRLSANCPIVNCIIRKGECCNCRIYPCYRLKQLDKRYRMYYNYSIIKNLDFIKEHGVLKFIAVQSEDWRCENCGELMCVQTKKCLKCKTLRNKINRI